MRLLLVEDDELLGAAVQKGLTRTGYAVDWVRTGADDYMVKPVDLDEVGARLRALSRRIGSSREPDAEIEYGPLKLVPSRHLALWHGAPVRLTKKEYWLLETFLRNKNKVLSRAQLEESLYGWGEEIGSNTVEVYIHFLRRKFSPALIQTERGVGYQLGSLSIFDA